MENLFSSNSITGDHIATKFGTCHDSPAVVPCAKFCSDHFISTWMGANWNFHHISEMGPWIAKASDYWSFVRGIHRWPMSWHYKVWKYNYTGWRYSLYLVYNCLYNSWHIVTLWCHTDTYIWVNIGQGKGFVASWNNANYLNQCWLIISKVQWHSSKGNLTKGTSVTNHWN